MTRLILFFTLSLSLLIFVSTANATILNVPEDYETIVEAIEATEDGDTVLVQPGIYLESLDFQGRSITVASLFLIDNDEEFIESTVIDAQRERSGGAVFENGEDENSILTGFTIQNGQTDFGGGVYIRNASPVISHCWLRFNFADQAGGGIYIADESVPTIESCNFMQNEAGDVGGGIAFYGNSSGVVNECHFQENSARNYGGALYANGSTPEISADSFSYNESGSNGGGIHATQGSVVNGEDISLRVNNSYRGGAICLYNQSRMTLTNVVIDSNSASTFGGGIQCGTSSSLTMNNATITNNFTVNIQSSGGGIYCNENAEITINNGSIAFNRSHYGNAINIRDGGVRLNQVVISDNINEGSVSSMRVEGLLELNQVTITGHDHPINCTMDALIYITNSILWNDEVVEINPIEDFENISIVISFSDVQEGTRGISDFENINIEWLDGMIDENPLFISSEEFDYRLQPVSPCINSGNPGDDLDADGSIADMGGIPFLHGIVQGILRDALSGEPIANGIVTNGTGVSATSNDEGFYQLFPVGPNPFNLQAECSGYNIGIREGLEVEVGNVIEVSFDLDFGILVPTVENFNAELSVGESASLPFSLRNTGEGVVTYRIVPQLRGNFYAPLNELYFTLQAGELVADDRLYGVAYGDNRIFVAGANNRTPMLYVFNHDGEYLESTSQINNNLIGYGMRDLEWSNGVLWGAVEDSVFGFTYPDMEILYRFASPVNPTTCLTFNPETETIWLSSVTSNFYECSVWGEVLREVDSNDLRIYGLAYFAGDDDGYPLYVSSFNSFNNEISQLVKVNPEDGSMLVSESNYFETDERVQGISLSYDYLERNWTLFRIINNAENDYLECYIIDAFTEWMQVEPDEGQINSNSQVDFILTLDATETDAGIWEGDLAINHPDARGVQTLIPVNLTVNPASVEDELTHPSDFGLTDIYPNPFNSTVRISFHVESANSVLLQVYDLSGRLVNTLYDAPAPSGIMSVVWRAEEISAGTYICRLSGQDFSEMRKIVLLK